MLLAKNNNSLKKFLTISYKYEDLKCLLKYIIYL